MILPQAFTIDLPYRTPHNDATQLMILMSQALDAEVAFTIEEKKANRKKHIHGYVSVHPSRLENLLKNYFEGLSFKVEYAYDIKGWNDYITKENNLQIATPK